MLLAPAHLLPEGEISAISRSLRCVVVMRATTSTLSTRRFCAALKSNGRVSVHCPGRGGISGAARVRVTEVSARERSNRVANHSGGKIDHSRPVFVIEMETAPLSAQSETDTSIFRAVWASISCTSRQPRFGFAARISAAPPAVSGLDDEVPPKEGYIMSGGSPGRYRM